MSFQESLFDELQKLAGEIGRAANTLAAMQHRIPSSKWVLPKVRPSLEVLTHQARSNALSKIKARRQLGRPNKQIRSEVLGSLKHDMGTAYFNSER